MSEKELEKYKDRLYQLKDKAIICSKNKDFIGLKSIGEEMKKIKKNLKQAQKQAKKKEKNNGFN